MYGQVFTIHQQVFQFNAITVLWVPYFHCLHARRDGKPWEVEAGGTFHARRKNYMKIYLQASCHQFPILHAYVFSTCSCTACSSLCLLRRSIFPLLSAYQGSGLQRNPENEQMIKTFVKWIFGDTCSCDIHKCLRPKIL